MENKRYVKLLEGWSDDNEFVGEIFDTEKDFQEQFKKFKFISKSLNWEYILSAAIHSRYFEYVSEKEYWKQELKKGRFVKGGYYRVDEEGNNNIFKHDKGKNAEYYLGDLRSVFRRNGGCFNGLKYVVASDFEIAWLEACNKANRFIDEKTFQSKYLMEKVLNTLKDNMEDQKIIEYRVKPEFRKLSQALFSTCKQDHKGGYARFDVDSNIKDFYKSAGVLNLWFEPVYEKELKVGDYIYFLTSFDGTKAGHVAKITNITSDPYKDSKGWISYSPHSRNGGGFRWESNGYFLDKDFRLATEEEIEDFKTPIKIKDYSVEFKKDYIKIGCKTYRYADVESLMKVILDGLEVEHAEEIKKVWKKLNT